MPSNRMSLGALLLVTVAAIVGLVAAYDATARDGRGGGMSKAIRTTLG